MSVIGPALGGGHGLVQGLHGLTSDNILGMNVTLANGLAVTVSETQNADLKWAMRGAGHNFGIVTSMKMRLHPIETHHWVYKSYVFSGRHLDAIFERVNQLQQNGTGPVLMAGNFGMYMASPEASTKEV